MAALTQKNVRLHLVAGVGLGVLLLGACDNAEPAGEAASFRVTVENISNPNALSTSMGDANIAVAPGIWALHDTGVELYGDGSKASTSLESLAEDGDMTALSAELLVDTSFAASDFFGARRDGGYDDAPIMPGDTVMFAFDGGTDQRLALAAMFGQSNDVMIASSPQGLALDLAVDEVREVGTALSLWDVGTELNEEPGAGENQPETQAEKGAGTVEDELITALEMNTDRQGFAYPAVESFLRVSILRIQ